MVLKINMLESLVNAAAAAGDRKSGQGNTKVGEGEQSKSRLREAYEPAPRESINYENGNQGPAAMN